MTKEQEICVDCGFCCDGTLFNQAVLKPAEKGNLPHWMEENYREKEDDGFFPLPCAYFDGNCTIYNYCRPRTDTR
jgi:hypothetical protein